MLRYCYSVIVTIVLFVGVFIIPPVEIGGSLAIADEMPSPPYVSEERREKFKNKFLNAPFNRAFAISKDGAFGGRWSEGLSLDEVREFALESCRKKPQYRPENPCKIYMENDAVVWVD